MPEPALPDPASGSRWANRMRRAFGFDVLACARCSGRLRLIALLDESAVTQRILRHRGLPAEVPQARPAPPVRHPWVPTRCSHLPVPSVSPVPHDGGVREAEGLPSTRQAALATAVSCARPLRACAWVMGVPH